MMNLGRDYWAEQCFYRLPKHIHFLSLVTVPDSCKDISTPASEIKIGFCLTLSHFKYTNGVRFKTAPLLIGYWNSNDECVLKLRIAIWSPWGPAAWEQIRFNENLWRFAVTTALLRFWHHTLAKSQKMNKMKGYSKGRFSLTETSKGKQATY
jgi:hypothetical protein